MCVWLKFAARLTPDNCERSSAIGSIDSLLFGESEESPEFELNCICDLRARALFNPLVGCGARRPLIAVCGSS